jgi:hypothetical protein
METAAMAVAQQAAGSLGGGGVVLAILVGLAVVMVISAFQMASIKGR